MATIDERRGTIFAGRYRLERKLGSGGMADVWLAEDQELGRKVAIKMLHERYANDAQFVERFRREATHAAGLSHPNVVSIFDRGEVEGSYFIVMEYVEGRTLKELIVTRGPCPVPVAVSYVRQVLAALRYAHRNGIVHRDIKPHNVLVDHEGRVKVADFGIARAGSSQMTEAGSIIGTAQYLSPEQARGAPVDESSDLYSTGILLYELLTGKVPFTGETPVEIAMKHLSQVPEAPSTIRGEIPRDLDLVVLRALAKEPADRYRTAKEMDRDLELVGRGEAVAPETEEAATMVLRGESTAATALAPAGRYGGDERYRSYEGEVRRGRAWWPWLLALGVAIALGVGAWLFYDNVQNELDANEPVAVENYEGILEELAVAAINSDGFEPRVRRLPNGDVERGYVYEQEPSAGSSQPRGSLVTILVSSGKRKISVPSLVGESRDAAVAELTNAGLDADVHEVPSDRTPGLVTAQNPRPGTVVVEGASVRINVSQGPRPVAVPNVVGSSYDVASAQLQTAGFTVGRVEVDSNSPAGQVVEQTPPGNSTATRGSPVTLSVSRGPQTETVPDVSLQEGPDARATLRAAGFRVQTTRQETDDEALDGLVMSQDPPGGSQADPRSIVTIVIGEFVPPPEVTPPPPPPTDTTTDTHRHNDRHDDRHDAHPVSRRVRLAVLAGGRSSEHEISLASAASVVAALDPERYEVRMVEIGRDGRWALPAGDRRSELTSTTTAETLPVPADSAPATLGAVDVVLPILHGPFGEDGTVQGLCELAGVAYVGPGVLASSVCMDKDVFKTLMRGAGVPVARHVALRLGDPVTNPFGYPVFVKPANMGSSVGISKVREAAGLEEAVALARRHDEKVMVEEFVQGMEIEVGVLGNLPSPVASLPGKVVANNADWYDYSSKYDEGGSELLVPTARPRRRRRSSEPASLRWQRSSRRPARAWPVPTSSFARPTARS